jgi:Na+/H+ antiporter NhaD/arsenite permease-like protein
VTAPDGSHALIALAILAATYAGLALGRLPVFRVDRTGIAIIGATLMIVTGVEPYREAAGSVDAQTLGLLFGMMIVTAYLRLSGFFDLIGSFSGLGYRTFLAAQAPAAILGLAAVFVTVWLVYRRQLGGALAPVTVTGRSRVHYPLMIKTSAAVGVMLVAYLAGVPIGLVAIAGAAYTLLTRRVKPGKVYREVDWGLLVLFTGLFVVIGGVEASGLARDLLGAAQALDLERPAMLTLVAVVLSNTVSNVPAVLLLKPVIPTFADPARAWLLLAMASTFAGNLTIVGSVANLIVVEAARAARVEVGFLEYLKVGVPVTVVTLVIGWLSLVVLRG